MSNRISDDAALAGAELDHALAASILDVAPDAILLVADDGTIRLANGRARELFGYSAAEFAGLEVEALVPPAARNLHAAHRAAYAEDQRTRAMGSGLDLSAVRKDGSSFPVEIALSPIAHDKEQSVVAIIRDVTDRVEAEQRIREIQQTLDATQEGVFVFDADSLRYAYVNEGAAQQVGYPADELLGMSPLDVNPTMGEQELRALLQPLLARTLASRTIVTRHRHRDGSEVDVECVFQCPEVLRDGDRRSVVAFSRDITDRLATERRLRAAEQVLSVQEDRERIARDLHDTAIQRLFAAGMTLQALTGQLDGGAASRLGDVIEELDTTIRDIRHSIFRLTAHNLDPTSVRRQVVEVVDGQREALGLDPGLQFSGPVESIDQQVVPHLLATLREALSNVARHARADNVQVELSVSPEEVSLAVVDDGDGLPPDLVPGGGLANLSARAEQLGGSLTVEPGSPRGTRLRWRVAVGQRAD